MKKAPRLTPFSLLLIFVILGSTCGVQRAHAATVNMFTGTWRVDSPDAAYRDKQSISNLEGLFGFQGRFSFNGSISNYSDGQVCPIPSTCMEVWSGTFSGGSVSWGGSTNQSVEYLFTGTITDGSFSGDAGCNSEGECSNSNRATFSFTSTWTNGWRSDGTLLVDSCTAFLSCLSAPGSIGSLSITTMTPEPGSMTLLGSGILAVAVFLRRRVRNSSPCSQKAPGAVTGVVPERASHFESCSV